MMKCLKDWYTHDPQLAVWEVAIGIILSVCVLELGLFGYIALKWAVSRG